MQFNIPRKKSLIHVFTIFNDAFRDFVFMSKYLCLNIHRNTSTEFYNHSLSYKPGSVNFTLLIIVSQNDNIFTEVINEYLTPFSFILFKGYFLLCTMFQCPIIPEEGNFLNRLWVLHEQIIIISLEFKCKFWFSMRHLIDHYLVWEYLNSNLLFLLWRLRASRENYFTVPLYFNQWSFGQQMKRNKEMR